MFLIYLISYGYNGGALVFLEGAEASASPSFALPMFITIKKKKILHLFLGVATPLIYIYYLNLSSVIAYLFILYNFRHFSFALAILHVKYLRQ